jgi:putative ABC transport system permease protein
MAATLGLLFAYWAIPLIATMIEAPAGVDLAPDSSVYLFLGTITLVSGVAAGLAPAWHGRGNDLVTALKGEGARVDRLAPRRMRSTLVATQAAVAVVLLVMSALFVRATFRAATIEVGFGAAGLSSVSPGLGNPFDPDRGAVIGTFIGRALSALGDVPGVAAVTLAETTPFSSLTRSSVARDDPARVVYFNRTRPEYFEAIGLRVLAGRAYTRDEAAARAPVALISESLARAYWQTRSPLGAELPEVIPVTSMPEAGLLGTRPIVIGVVADTITQRLHERNVFAVYEPLDPTSERFAHLLIRTAPDASSGALSEMTQRLRAIDPQAEISITNIASLLQQAAARPRMFAVLSGVVGLIAIVLCVIGLYGLTASVVGQRAREMGIRVALGAKPQDLFQLVMWDSLRPVVFGLAAAGGALLASRVLAAAIFFGVSPQDPMALAGASALLLVSAVLAVVVPTRRAAAVDAAVILRRS